MVKDSWVRLPNAGFFSKNDTGEDVSQSDRLKLAVLYVRRAVGDNPHRESATEFLHKFNGPIYRHVDEWVISYVDPGNGVSLIILNAKMLEEQLT